MESLFNIYQTNQKNNIQTDDNSSIENKKFNSFSFNMDLNNNDDNYNSISILNNINDKEETPLNSSQTEKTNNLLIPHKRMKKKKKTGIRRKFNS